ncbi:MAG: PEGA domain-containing protein [bacterium]
MRQGTTMPASGWKISVTAAVVRLAVIITFAGPAVCPATAAAKKDVGCDISVVSDPAGAVVTFDGRKEQTQTPVTIHTATGTHFLIISKAGHIESRQRFTIGPDQTKKLIDAKLESIRGLVLIHSDPMGAEITIDDAQRGQTPLLLTDLPPGRYRVRGTLQGTLPVEKILDVVDRTPQKLDIVMRSDSGIVKCSSEPSGAEVTVNGAARGQTPCTVSGLSPGKAVVLVSLEGYQPHEETVDIHTGDELTVEAALKPLPASLEVFSVPEGAVVYVNNERRGKSPLTLDNLPPAECRIRVEHPGYDPLARTVELKQGKRVSEEFKLDRIAGALDVTTTPAGVRVQVDNVEKGVTKGDTNTANGASLPLTIENLQPGSHSIVMTRKGYEKVTVIVDIEKSKKATLEQELKRVFVPDILLRTGDGQDNMFTGAVAERFPNGDIKLELKPGVFKLFKKSDILSEKPLFGDGSPRKE